MLKTKKNGKTWLVTQPDHAAVSGYLAAHWGNDAFARPGEFAPAPDALRLRAETVLAIAEHDNGWWEWEACPTLHPDDGLPVGLSESLADQQAGMERWRLGIRRFRDTHPYVSLLISRHAFLLYSFKVRSDEDAAFVHPLFANRTVSPMLGEQRSEVEQFLGNLEADECRLMERIAADPATQHWIAAEHLDPHIRLLQLLDTLSLTLCSSLIPAVTGTSRGHGQDALRLQHVPRRDWQDRTELEVLPRGDGPLIVAPYPFDTNPLRVAMPARVFADDAPRDGDFFSWWHAQQRVLIQFEFTAG